MTVVAITLTKHVPGEAPVTRTEPLQSDDVLFMFRLCGRMVLGLRGRRNGLNNGEIDPDTRIFTTPDEGIHAKLEADGARMKPVQLCTNDDRVNGIPGHVNTTMIEEIRRVRGVYCKTVIAFYDGQEVIALEPEANLRQRIGRPAPA